MKTLRVSILMMLVIFFVLGFGKGAWSSPALPDLTVVKVEADYFCRLKITLANIGGDLPPIAYNPTTNGVAISITSGNTSLGFMRLCDADPMKKLKKPHRRLSFIWKPNGSVQQRGLLPGKNRIKVTVDCDNMLTESNENNNSLERVITCRKFPKVNLPGVPRPRYAGKIKPPVPTRPAPPRPAPPTPLPDLTVTKIEKTSDCKIKVTIANLGKGKLSPIDYDGGSGGVWIGMKNGTHNWGSMVLGAIDHNKRVMNPGGRITFLWDSGRRGCSKLLPGRNVIKVTIDTVNNVRESNETNNTLTRTLTCPWNPARAIQEPRKIPRKPLPREKVESVKGRTPLNQHKAGPEVKQVPINQLKTTPKMK